MKILQSLAKLCAILAGVLLTAITLMTCASLIGRKSRTVEVEWVEDMNKKGFDGKHLLAAARSQLENHTKTTRA